MSELSLNERASLRQYLVDRFNLSELQTLCFKLGVDYEMLPHSTKDELSRELIGYFERRDNIRCLVEGIVQERPSDEMVALMSKVGACSPRQKVQIVLPKLKLANLNKKEVLDEIARLLGVGANEVMLIGAAAGSVRILVSLPAEAAQQLVTLKPEHLGGHEVSEVTLFTELPAAAQAAWRTAVLDAWSASSGMAIPGFTGPLLLRIFVWLAALALVVIGVRAALPSLSVINGCNIVIDERWPVPVIGEVEIRLKPGESERFTILPGQYEFVFEANGEIRARVPLVGEIGPFFSAELPASFQGEPLVPGQVRQERAGMFDNFELQLCP